jgi:ketosteroid isomerase-like protein
MCIFTRDDKTLSSVDEEAYGPRKGSNPPRKIMKRQSIHGDSAVLTGTWKESRKAKDGKVTDVTGRFTDVWLKMAGQWKLEAEHASPDAVR